MTPILMLGHAVLAIGWLALARVAPETRARAGRFLGSAGVGLGLSVVLFRSTLPAWRAIDIDPTSAVVAGVASACAWGLVLSLDLGTQRWWVGALTGVGATGMLLFAGSIWTGPALLFLACCAAPTYVALARSGRAALLTVALADAGLVVALVSDSVVTEGWALPSGLGGRLLVPLLAAVALRVGLVPRLGTPLRSSAAALIPITCGVGFIALLRLVERPQPVAAVIALLVAVGAVAWSVLRRSLDPSIIILWPAASAVALCLASPQAGFAAAVAGVLGITVVVLWPEALERGRLSRGFLLSACLPNVAFGALATTAVGSFERAGAGGPAREVVAWNVLSALLPVACASGVALGVFIARAEPRGGYHPEAVFMTWIVLAGSVVAGVILGTGAVYEVLGGAPAAILFGGALVAGAIASARWPGDDQGLPAHSVAVELSDPFDLARWSIVISAVVIAAGSGTIGWLILSGLEVGFL